MPKYVDHETNLEMIKLFKEGMKTEDIAEKIGLHPHTVRARIRKYQSNMKEKVEAKIDSEIDEIIDQLQGQQPKNIVKKILDILDNEENLQLEFMSRGIDPLNRVLGTIIDKALKLYEIDQKRHMQDERSQEQDNFFSAMTEALERLIDVDKFVDPDSKIDVS